MKLPPELLTRIKSAAIIIAIALCCIYVGGALFSIFIIVGAIYAAKEWRFLVEYKKLPEASLLKWKLFGLFYIAIPTLSLIYIRDYALPLCNPCLECVFRDDGMKLLHGAQSGPMMLLWLMVVVWATDIMAYFGGKLIGGPKIAPSISPKKTWAGLISGMIGAAVAAQCIAIPPECWMVQDAYKEFVSNLSPAVLGMCIALIAQLGDFFESSVKRTFGVKDAGNLIPGHGGILDRADGLMFTAPLVALALLIMGA
jgi:phosphatidate cytidylyltransferase